MKPITLHPLSVLFGLALAGVLVVVSAAQGTRDKFPLPKEVHFVGEVPAEWWTLVELNTSSDGTTLNSFTVPLDRYFVVTLMQSNNVVLANGQSISGLLYPVTINALSGGSPLPDRNGTHAVVPPGTLLTASNNSFAQLWGYLEPRN